MLGASVVPAVVVVEQENLPGVRTPNPYRREQEGIRQCPLQTRQAVDFMRGKRKRSQTKHLMDDPT